MIIQEVLYQFKLQAERLDTKKSKDLSLPTCIAILNSAQINLLKSKYGVNNLYRSGFEATTKRKQDLQRFSVLNEEIAAIPSTGNTYQFDLSFTSKPFLFDTRVQFKASKNTCLNKILNGYSVQTDDMNLNNMNAFKRPSFEWRRVYYRVSEDKIHVEADDTFSITKMVLDYLRYPKNMDIEGYLHFDGRPSANVNCELPDFLVPELVAQAALEYKLWSENPGYQFSQLNKSLGE